MPSKTYWIDKPYIMSADYIGTISVGDLDNVMESCLLEVEDKIVSFLVDMSQSTSFPANILKVASLSKLTSHPNSRWFAFVEPPGLVRFAMQVMHRRFAKSFDNRDEALAFLRQQIKKELKVEPADPAQSPMRTDLIAAWLVHQWLTAHAPSIAAAWPLEVSEDIKTFAARVKNMYDHMDAVFTSQTAIAATAIQRWNLQQVAILGGGSPNPLSPPPDRVALFTDVNPAVLGEASHKGYKTAVVDARDPAQLSDLKGIQTVIATGLFHYLDKASIQILLTNLARVGVRTVVFNNVEPAAGQALMDQWNKLGFQMYAREKEEMPGTLPIGWQIDHAESISQFIRHHPQIGEQLAQQPDIYAIYKATYSFDTSSETTAD